ncbi:MAG: amidohydrolase family protein [Candidatus Binatia bacterium]
MLKIDVYNHILTQKYFDKLNKVNPNLKDIGKRVRNIPVLIDVDLRLKQLEEFGDDYRQLLSLVSPPLELAAGPDASPELAQVANDEMAKLVDKYDRFVGFIASLPMNNHDACVVEIKRAVEDLGARGV